MNDAGHSLAGGLLPGVSAPRSLSIIICKSLESSGTQFEHSPICLKHSRPFSFSLAQQSVRIVSFLPPREIICLQNALSVLEKSHKPQAEWGWKPSGGGGNSARAGIPLFPLACAFRA